MSEPGHPPREALVAADSDARLDAATREVLACSATATIHVVAPSRLIADDFARRVAKARGAHFGLHRYGFHQLAIELAQARLAHARRHILPRGSQRAIVARALFAARAELAVLQPTMQGGALTGALARSLSSLRHAGVGSERLSGDLRQLLAGYESILAEQNLADDADAFRAAAASIRDGGPSIEHVVLLDPPIHSTVEMEFAKALVDHARRALVVCPEGDELAIAAFSHLPRLATGTKEETLCSRLFQPAWPGPPSTELEWFAAPHEGREAVEVVRRVLRLAAAGIALDDIAVVVRAPHAYGRPLGDAFKRAGLPVYFASGVSRPHPSGRALLSLLHCRQERLSAVRLAEYLSLGQTPELPADRAMSVRVEGEREGDEEPTHALSRSAPARWESLIASASVGATEERWEKQLGGLEGVLIAKRDQATAKGHAARALGCERDLAALRDLRRFVLPLVETMAAWSEAAPWPTWIARLCTLARMALRTPDAVLAAIEEHAAVGDADAIGLAEVIDALTDVLTEVRVPPPRTRHGAVFIGTPEQVRGRAFEAVFVVGLAEQVFPGPIREDPLLLDEEKAKLGAMLPTRASQAAEERMRLRLAVGCSRRKVFASYPRFDLRRGRSRVPSYYAVELVRAATGDVLDADAMRDLASERALDQAGWPAPARPEDAIDDVEHDLAVLHRHFQNLRRGDKAPSGAVRYILEENNHLARALRARFSRWDMRSFGPDDGLMAPSEACRERVAARAPSVIPRGVSAIERFFACPYQYFLASVIGLTPRPEVESFNSIDPRLRGILMHEAQVALFERLRDRGGIEGTPPDESRQLLDGIVDDLALRTRGETFPAIEQVFDDAIAGLRADLHGWLSLAREDHEHRYQELALAFGRSDGGPAEGVCVAGGARLVGEIDAIETSAEGALRVTDFKSGRDAYGPAAIIAGGQSLQPVLYCMVLEAMSSSSQVQRTVLGGRLYFCTAKGGFSERTVLYDQRARRLGERVLGIVEEAHRVGFFPAMPIKDACNACAYRPVCGPAEEERIRRKDGVRLGPPFGELVAIRKER